MRYEHSMMTTISPHARAEATARLRAAGCVFAEDEEAVLSAAAADEAALTELVGRRAAGEPLEQVVGFADFAGVRVRLRPGVFVPRVRSELLVRLAAEATARRVEPLVVDLCCGSGALGAAVVSRVPSAALHAADVDPVAVACARDNLAGLGDVHQGDLFQALPSGLRGRVDVLLANVPYVASRHIALLPAEARLHEPRVALDGGEDGLDVLRAVVSAAPQWLAPGGTVFSEITGAQVTAASAVMGAAGLSAEVTEDDDLDATVVQGTRPLR
jgi:release factor glutamine methyltransferase